MPTTVATSTGSFATAWGKAHHLLFAADGTACLFYSDGTSYVYRSAVAPYTSWSAPVTLMASQSSGTIFCQNATIDATDTIHWVGKGPSGALTVYYAPLTYSAGSHSWSAGTLVNASGTGGDNGAPGIVLDPNYATNGRRWLQDYQSGGTANIYQSTDGVTWTISISGLANSFPGGNLDWYGLFATGNYLVWVRWTGTGFGFRRLDTTGTLTAWTAETAVTVSGAASATSIALAVDGNGTGLLVASAPSAVAEYILPITYNPAANTWSVGSTLGAVSDSGPSLVRVGGDVYLLWAQFAATNSYAIVYKKWTASTSTWDASPTMLEASGANRQWVDAGASGTTLLAWAWTEGTASPYNVQFDSVALGGTGAAIAATGQGATSATATVAQDLPLAATALGATAASATVAQTLPIVATATGTTSGQAATTLAMPVAATGAGTTSATTAVTPAMPLAATAGGTTSAAAAVTEALPVAATALGTTSGAATVTAALPVAATASGVTSGTANVTIPGGTAIAATASGTTSGAVGVVAPLPIVATGVSTTAGTADVALPAGGAIVATGLSTTGGTAGVTPRLAIAATGLGSTTAAAIAQYPLLIAGAGTGVTSGLATAHMALAVAATGVSTTGGTVTMGGATVPPLRVFPAGALGRTFVAGTLTRVFKSTT